MKLQYGCEADIREFEFFEEKLKRCPRRPFLDMPDTINEVFEQWAWLQRGLMPSTGSWYDQTEAYVTFMDTMADAISTGEKHMMDKQASGGGSRESN